jgi:hypothetical protein
MYSFRLTSSVADPDLGYGIRSLFYPWTRIRDPGSEIGFFSGSRISDPGYQTHLFESLVTNFWLKNSIFIYLFENWPKQHFKNKIIYNFVKFVAIKKGKTTNCFSPVSFVAVFGSWIRDLGWVKIRIRDPG